MMKKLNKDGSILVMAVSIVLLIFVILGIVLTIATSYQKRAIQEHARKQAYLNGLSIAETIAGQIAVPDPSFIPKTTSDIVDINKVELPNGYGGTATAKIKYVPNSEDELYIQVTSVYSSQTEEVQITMKKQDNQWYIKLYSGIGDEFNDENK